MAENAPAEALDSIAAMRKRPGICKEQRARGVGGVRLAPAERLQPAARGALRESCLAASV